MKFNVDISDEEKEFLEQEYKEYIKVTPMTKKEQRAVREWVKDGNSVYENYAGGWYDGGVPIEFLTVWRDDEYIRTHTKGMTPEETHKFALAYYGWDDEPAPGSEPISDESGYSFDKQLINDINAELPFR
jgi:hypothetical protein